MPIPADFDYLMTCAVEALDGIEYRQLKRVLRVLRPDMKVRAVHGKPDQYTIEFELPKFPSEPTDGR